MFLLRLVQRWIEDWRGKDRFVLDQLRQIVEGK